MLVIARLEGEGSFALRLLVAMLGQRGLLAARQAAGSDGLIILGLTH